MGFRFSPGCECCGNCCDDYINNDTIEWDVDLGAGLSNNYCPNCDRYSGLVTIGKTECSIETVKCYWSLPTTPSTDLETCIDYGICVQNNVNLLECPVPPTIVTDAVGIQAQLVLTLQTISTSICFIIVEFFVRQGSVSYQLLQPYALSIIWRKQFNLTLTDIGKPIELPLFNKVESGGWIDPTCWEINPSPPPNLSIVKQTNPPCNGNGNSFPDPLIVIPNFIP